MKNSWINIKDRYPERNTRLILLCIGNTYAMTGRYGAFHQDTEPSFWTEDYERLAGMEITHWQPIELPEKL